MPMTQELCRVHGCSQHNDGHTEHDTDLVLHCVCDHPTRRLAHLPECSHCGRFIYVAPAPSKRCRVKITGDYGALEVSRYIDVDLPANFDELDEEERDDVLDDACFQHSGIASYLEAVGFEVHVGETDSWSYELVPERPVVEL